MLDSSRSNLYDKEVLFKNRTLYMNNSTIKTLFMGENLSQTLENNIKHRNIFSVKISLNTIRTLNFNLTTMSIVSVEFREINPSFNKENLTLYN